MLWILILEDSEICTIILSVGVGSKIISLPSAKMSVGQMGSLAPPPIHKYATVSTLIHIVLWKMCWNYIISAFWFFNKYFKYEISMHKPPEQETIFRTGACLEIFNRTIFYKYTTAKNVHISRTDLSGTLLHYQQW